MCLLTLRAATAPLKQKREHSIRLNTAHLLIYQSRRRAAPSTINTPPADPATLLLTEYAPFVADARPVDDTYPVEEESCPVTADAVVKPLVATVGPLLDEAELANEVGVPTALVDTP